MVKIDVDAIGKMLDDLLAPVVRSPYEDLEPECEYMPDPPKMNPLTGTKKPRT